MSTGDTGHPVRPANGQAGHVAGGGHSLNAGGSITITQAAPPPPPRRPRVGAVLLCAALVGAAVLGALVERKLAERDSAGPAAEVGAAASPSAVGSASARTPSPEPPPAAPPVTTASPEAATGFTTPPAAGGPSSPSVGAPPPAAGPAHSSPPAGTAETVRFEGTVRLTASVDLDENPPRVLSEDEPPLIKGFGVHYILDAGGQGASAANSGGLAPLTGSTAPTRRQCSDLLSTQASYSLPIERTTRFCARTVFGRIALVTVEEFRPSGFRGAFNATVLVWNGTD
ncbi:hypothetical protein ACFVFS_03665 [Kitasatospora sp. NPDC057692]|uniref:hypothetical protein n=1 Tax=Kitasatospora sp. NPDC057692 TaxID=3346215 RepID=UPI0036954309